MKYYLWSIDASHETRYWNHSAQVWVGDLDGATLFDTRVQAEKEVDHIDQLGQEPAMIAPRL